MLLSLSRINSIYKVGFLLYFRSLAVSLLFAAFLTIFVTNNNSMNKVRIPVNFEFILASGGPYRNEMLFNYSIAFQHFITHALLFWIIFLFLALDWFVTIYGTPTKYNASTFIAEVHVQAQKNTLKMTHKQSPGALFPILIYQYVGK